MCLFSSKPQNKEEPGAPTPTKPRKKTTVYWSSSGDYYLVLWDFIRNGFDFNLDTPVFCSEVIYELISEYGGLHRGNLRVISFESTSPVSKDTLFKTIKNTFCWIDDVAELLGIKNTQEYYDIFVPKKIVSILNGKYSESFSLLLASRSLTSRELIKKALTLYDEGLSPDMRAYLLLMDNENKRTG